MDTIKKKLNAHHLKATPTRIGVLCLVKDHEGAIPFSVLQKELSGTDRITLFRTLNALIESGIVHKAHFQNDESYYAMCPSSCSSAGHIHDHVHFKCNVCETVSCRQLPEGVKIELKEVVVEKVEINVVGVCEECV